MEYRTLEIKLQDAKDLNRVNLITQMAVYVVVSISGGDTNSNHKIKSPVDRNGDANPTWNFPMKFTVDETALHQNRLTLDFKIICERALGNKDVGEVQVPIKELLNYPAKFRADGKRFISYQVRKPNGKPKGQLTFSYQFGDKNADAPPQYPVAPPFWESEGKRVMANPAGPSSGYPPPPSGVYPPPAIYPLVAYPVAPLYGKSECKPMTNPAGPSSGHWPPPWGVYPPPDPYPIAVGAGGGYYPPPGAYPPAGGYGYQSPPPYGYGYPPSQSWGYGYPPQQEYAYPRPPVWG